MQAEREDPLGLASNKTYQYFRYAQPRLGCHLDKTTSRRHQSFLSNYYTFMDSQHEERLSKERFQDKVFMKILGRKKVAQTVPEEVRRSMERNAKIFNDMPSIISLGQQRSLALKKNFKTVLGKSREIILLDNKNNNK